MPGESLINIGELSKPATVLIEKISDAIGGLYKPYQIRRVAEAEAEAEIIRKETELKITDIQRRAIVRFVSEEARKQENIEEITQEAIPHLREGAAPQDIEDDWIVNFFDKCRIISDKEMQLLWARLLAEEANSPKTYSKRTVNLLSSLDKYDANLFASLCNFSCLSGGINVLVFEVDNPIYEQNGITFSALAHLDSIGLSNFNNITGFVSKRLPKNLNLQYYDKLLCLELPKEKDNVLPLGKAFLTKAGKELASICTPKKVDGFFEYLVNVWEKEKIKVKVL